MSRHWPSGDFFGAETIISAHGLLNHPMQHADTKITLPYRKKLEQCLADVEKAVVQMSSESGGSLLFSCFNSLELGWKVAVLHRAHTSYLFSLWKFGGRMRYRGKGPGVRVPCGPCRDEALHLKLGEDFCGCGILTDNEGGHYWTISKSDPSNVCHACGEECLMPQDWALKMAKQKGLDD